jgi:hypothetical protein
VGRDVFRVLDAISSPPLDLRFARRASSLSDCSTIASTALLLGIARRDDDQVASPLSMILLAVLCGISPNNNHDAQNYGDMDPSRYPQEKDGRRGGRRIAERARAVAAAINPAHGRQKGSLVY